MSKFSGESYIDIPDTAELERIVGGVSSDSGLFPSISNKGRNMAEVSNSFGGGTKGSKRGGAPGGFGTGDPNDPGAAYSMMQRDQRSAIKSGDQLSMLEHQLGQLRQENAQMRYQRELMNREFENKMYENNNLGQKLANLEKVFIGETHEDQNGFGGDDPSNKKYSHGLLVSENNELRARIEQAEQEKIELKGVLIQLEADQSPSTGLTRDNSRDLSPTSVRKIMDINDTNKGKTPQMYYNGQKKMENEYEDMEKPSSSHSKKSTVSSYMRFKRSMTKNL